ncbi:MAG: phosphomannomutase/phosphoglucomutase [Spirochaetes bacterium]|uniref:Phosphomannomutase/phosphoglucomutase n=1 Tax=Candidatus Aphodenecus pullistercoris TaxID=2840669 RepID=A0A9D9HA24_9SPIR|nr:phosphomannomutase/phosphoglucomutase [Candidatus Aphodenecus pullistercoris]
MGAFKAYDIRGVYNKDFDKETVYRIGCFLPRLLDSGHVLVGRDVRLSSDEIHDALCAGITDAGADVWDLGLCTTPMVYYATRHYDASASVQITASHNPPQYNGLKISRRDAIPVGGDSGLKELERMVLEEDFQPAPVKGKVLDYSAFRQVYIDYMKAFVPDLDGLDITVDCSNGMSALVVKDILGDRKGISWLNDNMDGSFPAHEPNPLEVENCRQIIQAVKDNGSDVGVIYDGDADRVMFIDEKGRFIQPDYITALIGYYYKGKGEVGAALQDIRTSRSTTEYLEKLGFTVTTWKVGHAYAKLKIREIKGIFGGELAGHYYFRDFGNCDSGILASLIVLSVVASLKKEGRSLGDFMSQIVCYTNSGEVNFRLERKDEAIQAIYERFVTNDHPTKVLDFDGYRIEFPDWWLNVRKSNTEPYLRIVCEARDEVSLTRRLDEVRSIIARFN